MISAQCEAMMGRTSEKVLEDAFESFIGALYLDGGIDICRKFLIGILETEIDYSQILYKDNNYKHLLMIFYHQQKWRHPHYYEISRSEPPKPSFTVGVKAGIEVPKNTNKKKLEIMLDNAKLVGVGTASKKQKGEQLAAKQALIHYGVLEEEQVSDDEIEHTTKKFNRKKKR